MVQGKGHYVISFRSSDELRTALLAGGSISVLLGTGFGAFAAVWCGEIVQTGYFSGPVHRCDSLPELRVEAGMERSEADENESSSSQQNTMWKQLQAKAKPLLSPKLGAREPEDKKERGMWMFKKMKRKENVVLDRVISSSQPDLLFSSPDDVDIKEAQLCGKAVGRDKLQFSIKHKSTSPNKPTVSQLVQSHHKSSSLGSACLERLAEPPDGDGGGDGATAAAAEKTHLESSEDQLVSSCLDDLGFQMNICLREPVL